MKNILFTSLLLAMLLSPISQAFAKNAQTAEQAIAIALEKNGGKGRVLGVRDKVSDDGEAYYQIKILLDGKVRIFRIGKE